MAIVLMTEKLHAANTIPDPVIVSAAGSVAPLPTSSALPILSEPEQKILFGFYDHVLLANRPALEFLNTSAGRGNPLAQGYLAVLCMSGTVLKQNMEAAKEHISKCWMWITNEAHNKSPYAQAILGHMHLNSIIAPAQSYKATYNSDNAAAIWFKNAAAQRHPEARYILAHMYMYGIGIGQDIGEVAKLLSGSVPIRIIPLAIRRVLLAHRPLSAAGGPAASFPSYDIIGVPSGPISEGLAWLMKTEGHSDALRMLWESTVSSDREAARPYLMHNMKTEAQPDAIRMLWESPEKSDRAAARLYVMCWLMDPIFHKKAKAIEMLLSSPEAVDIAAARFSMQSIVKGPMDVDQWIWIITLLSSKNTTHGLVAVEALRAIVEAPGRSLEYEATIALKKIAQDSAHPRQFDAIRVLGAISKFAASVSQSTAAFSTAAGVHKKPKKKADKKDSGPQAAPTAEEIKSADASAQAMISAIEDEEAEAQIAADARAEEKARKAEAAKAAKAAKAKKAAEAKAVQEVAAREAAEKAAQERAAAEEVARLEIVAREGAETASREAAEARKVAAAAAREAAKFTRVLGDFYTVDFLSQETTQISVDLKQTDYTPEVFFIPLVTFLGDDDLGIAETLALRRESMLPNRQPRQAVLDRMVVQAIEQARNAIRQRIGSTLGK
jgi:hypothetical protein